VLPEEEGLTKTIYDKGKMTEKSRRTQHDDIRGAINEANLVDCVVAFGQNIRQSNQRIFWN
jgi:hypothetical protein